MKKEIVIPCEGSKTKKCIIPVKEFKEIKRILQFIKEGNKLGIDSEFISFAFQIDVLENEKRETAEFGRMEVDVDFFGDQVEFIQFASGHGEVTSSISKNKLARLVR